MINFKKLYRSFSYAFSGIKQLIVGQQNARIHLIATVVVIIAAFWANVSASDWVALIFAIGLVLVAEGINTAIEHLANSVSTAYHPEIKKAKDIAAGAVIIAATIAVAIGIIVFKTSLWP
ncbi:MAG TPA: diacylglycerol kinase family protein [Prolixibacteraceae bacterium]|nr:diacylglycerol kinase family protein [Prolixibacteraceae bacterium]HPR59602.1 diacylglycerol kinase family protein [Prolixibacteraceae bacterium]